jgi:hypothetical protein
MRVFLSLLISNEYVGRAWNDLRVFKLFYRSFVEPATSLATVAALSSTTLLKYDNLMPCRGELCTSALSHRNRLHKVGLRPH